MPTRDLGVSGPGVEWAVIMTWSGGDGGGGGAAAVLVFLMVLLVSVQGWRCDALVLAWCDGFRSLRRCGGADVVMMAWRDDVVMLRPFCGGAVLDDG